MEDNNDVGGYCRCGSPTSVEIISPIEEERSEGKVAFSLIQECKSGRIPMRTNAEEEKGESAKLYSFRAYGMGDWHCLTPVIVPRDVLNRQPVTLRILQRGVKQWIHEVY